jgi:putative transposase
MTHQLSHRPPHIYKAGAIYFVTGKTYQSTPHFNTNAKKELLIKIINIATEKFLINVYAWVILENHYHLLLKTKDNNLPYFIGNIHANSSRVLRRLSPATPEKIWHQYWDRCIRSEKDFWTRFNYIHNNPIKHSYIKNLDELESYKFSSYNQWIRKNSKEWIMSCFSQYPIIDFSTESGSE